MKHADELRRLMRDSSPGVAVAAAETVAFYFGEADRKQAISVLVEHANLEQTNYYTAIDALNALGRIQSDVNDQVQLPIPQIRKLPVKAPDIRRGDDYVRRLRDFIVRSHADQSTGSDCP